MSRKILATATAIVAASLLLGGCSSQPTSGTTPKSGLKSIFFANPLPAYPDFAVAEKCFKSEAKKLGVAATSAGPTGTAVDNQFVLDRISQAVSQNVGAIILVPLSAQYEPLMKQAKAKGILLATMNTGDTTSTQNFTIGTDYANQGAKVAKEIGARGGEQNVGYVSNAPGGVGDTILNAFKKNLPSNVKVSAVAYDNADPATTVDQVEAMLRAHPEINIVFSWEGQAVAGITTAISEQGLKGKVFGVVNDLTPQVQAGIKDGTIYGSSKQNFCAMASKSVDDLVKLSKGGKVPSSTDTGITFVTKKNLSEAVADYNK